MDDYSVRRGATLPLSVTVNASEDPSTASLVLRKSITDPVAFYKTSQFIDGSADLTLQASDTNSLEVTEYIYQVTIVYQGNPAPVDKFPDTDDCDGECEFPKINVCPKLDPEVS